MIRPLALKTALNALYFTGAQAMSGGWLSGVGVILMLHHVRSEKPSRFDPNRHLSVTPEFLDRVLGWFSACNARFLPLQDFVRNISDPDGEGGPAVAITLDDGYRDNLRVAAPVFRKYGAPYTVFVAPGLVDGRADLWWEDLAASIAARSDLYLASPRGRVEFDVSTVGRKQRVFRELIEFLTSSVSETEQRRMVRDLAHQCGVDPDARRQAEIMTWQELASLARDPLCTIGAHTVHHYALSRLEKREALHEMEESASIIEMELGERPEFFAFPYGGADAAGEREFALAREAGFAGAVTTRHGVVYREHAGHLHALPRISLNGRFQALRYVETLVSGLPTRLRNRGAKLNVA